jgi:hypothetical protein
MDKPDTQPPLVDHPLDVLLNSVAIKRLVEEVRLEQTTEVIHGYNRIFNRHNR